MQIINNKVGIEKGFFGRFPKVDSVSNGVYVDPVHEFSDSGIHAW